MRLLDGLRLGGRVVERVVAASEVDAVFRPEAVHDLELLGEHLEPHARLREREPVRAVLALHPAGADPELDPPTGDVIDRRDGVREQAGQPEGGGRDERAEAERGRPRRERGERRPGVVRDVAGLVGLRDVVV